MKRSSKESQAKLFAIAESQGGFFTAKQAESAGFDRTHHAYHVRVGNWEREHRGIFRLVHFPLNERPDLIRWSLWSRDRKDHPQGVYSHQTALSIYDLSDTMPSKLHLTVPRSFRKNTEIPAVLVLHYADLPSQDIAEREGYRVTRPIRTILDLSSAHLVSNDILLQAFSEGKSRGIITRMDIEKYQNQLPDFLLEKRQPLQVS
jgi:predicted transcriptional regulator of viral defense system